MARVLARNTIHLGGWGADLGTVGLTDADDPRFENGGGLERVREGDLTRDQLNEIAETMSIPAENLSSKDGVITEIVKAVRKRDAAEAS